MTPDLTTTQTIGLASAIVGFCLTVFFTTLIVLTYGHQIRQYLRTKRIAGSAQTSDHPLTSPFPLCPPLPTARTSQRTTRGLGTPLNARQRLLGPLDDVPPPTSPPRPRSSYRIGRSLARGTPPLDPAMFHALQHQPPTTGTSWQDTSGHMSTLPAYPEPRVPAVACGTGQISPPGGTSPSLSRTYRRPPPRALH